MFGSFYVPLLGQGEDALRLPSMVAPDALCTSTDQDRDMMVFMFTNGRRCGMDVMRAGMHLL